MLGVSIICAVVIGILLVTWCQGFFAIGGAMLVVAASLVSFLTSHRFAQASSKLEDNSSKRFRTKRHSAWTTTLIVTVILCIAMFLICWHCRAVYWSSLTTFFDKSPSHWILIKLPTVAIQQVLLCLVLIPACRKFCSIDSCVAVICSIAFAICHLPNVLLMFLTLIGSLTWCVLFFRYQRLLPLIASHLLLAICAAAFCGEYILNLRVGEACIEMLPYSIGGKNDDPWVFPGCVIGELDRVEQSKEGFVVSGWSVDPIHNYVPTKFIVINNEGKIEEFLLNVDQLVERKDKLIYTGQHNVKCGVTIKLPNLHSIDFDYTEIYAKNKNGWCDKLKLVDHVRPIPAGASEYTVILLNPDADGYYQINANPDQSITLSGWAVDFDSQSPCDNFFFFQDGNAAGATLKQVNGVKGSLERPDIVQAYGKENYRYCGFQIGLEEHDPGKFRMFAQKKDGRLFELKRWRPQ